MLIPFLDYWIKSWKATRCSPFVNITATLSANLAKFENIVNDFVTNEIIEISICV